MKNRILLSFLLVVLGLYAQSQMITNDRYKKSLDEQYASGLFKGTHNSYMMVPAEDPAAMGSFTIFQYLQGRIPGLIINNTWPLNPSVQWRMYRPAFFLNEIRVDAATIALLNINDIGLVKVFRPPFVGAIGNGPGGAIAVYTLRGDEE
jgi:hypothetical protein